jgi:predicted transposase/invertase (TIGR01784 family)
MEKKSILRFDWAIKRLLRNKADHSVLEGFLSVLLKQELKIVSIRESESNKASADDKFNRVDIFVEDSKGELIIIELQHSYQVDYFLRMLYGVSKAIVEHIVEGDKYYKVRKVYHINIVHFNFGKGKDYVYHGTTEFRGIHNNELLQLTREQKLFFDRTKIHELYPEYYVLCTKNFNNLAKDKLDEWMYYLKNDDIPDHFLANGLKEAREQLRFDHLTDEEKRDYLHHIKQRVYEQSVIDDAYSMGETEGLIEGEAIGRRKGEAIGLAKGLEKGRTEGEAIGLEKGLEKEKEQTVIRGHKKGYSIDTIAGFSELSPDQILRFLKESGLA